MAFSNGIVLALPFLQKSFVVEEGSRALAGRFWLFGAGVVTYSRGAIVTYPWMSPYRVIKVRICAKFKGVSCSPEAFS